MAMLADLTPCAKSSKDCCIKTDIDHSNTTTNQTMKEDDDKDDNDNEDDKGQRQ